MTWCQGSYKTGFGKASITQLKRNTLLDFYLNYAKNSVCIMWTSWRVIRGNIFITPHGPSILTLPLRQQRLEKEFYKDMEDYATENYLVSFFGRLNYNLLNRYLLTFCFA